MTDVSLSLPGISTLYAGHGRVARLSDRPNVQSSQNLIRRPPRSGAATLAQRSSRWLYAEHAQTVSICCRETFTSVHVCQSILCTTHIWQNKKPSCR